MYRKYFKRLFDVIFSLSLILLLLPIMILIFFLVWFFNWISNFFSQIRPGLNNQIFTLYNSKLYMMPLKMFQKKIGKVNLVIFYVNYEFR